MDFTATGTVAPVFGDSKEAALKESNTIPERMEGILNNGSAYILVPESVRSIF